MNTDISVKNTIPIVHWGCEGGPASLRRGVGGNLYNPIVAQSLQRASDNLV